MSGITNPVMVVQGTGTNDPDRLIITGATDAPISSLRTASLPSDTVLNIQLGDESFFNTTDRKMIYIGRLETARITGVAANAITVSRNPLTAGVGLVNGYPVGTPIELVTVTTYDLAPAPTNFPGVPYLRRYLNSATPPVDVAAGIAALHIDSLQLEEQANSTIQLRVRGRTAKLDRHYSHPTVGDPYRRLELRSTFLVRNTP